MNNNTGKSRWVRLVRARDLLMIFSVSVCLSCVYMKMDPPPDADKPDPSLVEDGSCFLATAANMLAGAGYGTGNTVQDRADEIYGEMRTRFNFTFGGWTDAALDGWLGSTDNEWPNNPYRDVSVEGYKIPKYPWDEPTGAMQIADTLRDCNFIGLSLSWPTDAPNQVGTGGHAITAWGDHTCPVSKNPTKVRVTDSDTDAGGDVQVYAYDDFNNPNPGGPNEGNGWYIDYNNPAGNHGYMKHIIILEPVDFPFQRGITQKVVGSYRIHQDEKLDATDLHYKVYTDTDILSYRTDVSWPAAVPPVIVESQPLRRELTVDWNFSAKPVPYCTWITITTEFVLPRYNAVRYRDVYFTYPDTGRQIPQIGWEIFTPEIVDPTTIPNVTGGYVIGDFDIVDPTRPSGEQRVAEYRLVHEYSFDQDPEDHIFILSGNPEYTVTNLRFGHSYGFPRTEALWEFNNWMTDLKGEQFSLDDSIRVQIDWEDRLPYPEGDRR